MPSAAQCSACRSVAQQQSAAKLAPPTVARLQEHLSLLRQLVLAFPDHYAELTILTGEPGLSQLPGCKLENVAIQPHKQPVSLGACYRCPTAHACCCFLFFATLALQTRTRRWTSCSTWPTSSCTAAPGVLGLVQRNNAEAPRLHCASALRLGAGHLAACKTPQYAPPVDSRPP